MKSSFELKKEANNVSKSLSGVIRYIQKSGEPKLNEYLKSINVQKKSITFDLVLSNMTEREKNRITRQGENLGPREKFTLWTVLTALKRSTNKK